MTDKIIPQIEDWQNRPLSEVYPVLYIDAIHYSVRDNGVIRKLAAYVVLGINLDGCKEVLTIEIGENESSKYWLSVLNGLKNRRVNDVLLICADRKLKRQRSVSPSDKALLKALYLSTFEATKRWSMPIRNWGQVYGELSIMYDGRLPE